MPYSNPDDRRRWLRENYARVRREWLEEHGPCIRCESWEQLEIDHKDASQKVSHKVWSWSLERRDAELAKCQVLCHSCHAKKTWTEDGRKRAEHGDLAMYNRHGCRCDLCRAVKSINNAKRSRK